MPVHPELLQFLLLLPEPAILIDGTGRVLAANDAIAAMSAVDRGSLKGVNLRTLVEDDPEKVGDFLRLCARSRQLTPGSLRWLGKAQRIVEMRCDGAVILPRTDADAAVLFLRGRSKEEATDRFSLLNRKIEALSNEILERKRIQHERDRLLELERAARLNAERMGRVKDEFLATLSHELRTPLNAILGWTHVLQRSAPAPSDLTSGLASIERNARAQAKIVEDLLDMSRIIAGKIRLDVQPVVLATLIETVLDSLRPAAEGKSLRLHATLDPIAGPVKGDPYRLQQVVWNLLANAVKFSQKGGRVQVFLERVNSHVEIVVSDTGEGIAPEFLPYIFDRFRQADGSTTRRYAGLGLGLSIVKQLVELHGGSVRAKSPGVAQGATFIVALPLASAHDPHSDSGTHRQHPRGAAAPALELPAAVLQDLRVLVIDDEPDARELLSVLLEFHGAVVATADSAAAGLESMRAFVPQLILCDIGMPGQDGYEFARQLRALPQDQGGALPALAVTAFARTEDRTRALLAGFNGHLAKPVESNELIAMVANLAGRIMPLASTSMC